MLGQQAIPIEIIAFRWHLDITPARLLKQYGMTLIEVIVVLGILGVLASLAIPSYQGFQERYRLEGYAMALVTDIHFVRSESVAHNRGLRISFGTDAGGTCYLIHSGNASDCTCNSNGSAQCGDTTNSIQKSVGLATALGVRLQSNVASMLFDPSRGTTTPSGSINVIGQSGNSIRQVVNIMGRTRTCSPQGKVSGYKVC